ncbi:MAG: S-layer homology domain-containing protein, partial [Oscillospiraceae bacterium]|nr:S-layer homology domain-containing protein [Oscillospiraceae bacterium]
MKVLKKSLAALLVVIILLGVFPLGMIPAAGAVTAYTDVSGHWAADVIDRWNGFGFINPEIFRGSNFWPNRNITRGEFFSLIVYALGASAKADVSNFTDVYPDTWQYDIVAIANQMGIANGYPDGKMRPDDTLLRQEAATLAARAMGMSSVSDWTLSRFHDESSISPYARTFISALVEEGVMSGYPNGTFVPGGYLTRAEAVKLLNNLFANIYMPESTLRNVYLQGGLL